MNTRDLMKAWDEAVERATSDTARESDLTEGQLNAIAGMSVHSGIKGGSWGAANCSGQYSCGSNCLTCNNACD